MRSRETCDLWLQVKGVLRLATGCLSVFQICASNRTGGLRWHCWQGAQFRPHRNSAALLEKVIGALAFTDFRKGCVRNMVLLFDMQDDSSAICSKNVVMPNL